MAEAGLTDGARMYSEITVRLNALPDSKTATVRALRREYSKRLRRAQPAVVLQLAQKLVNTGQSIQRFFAYEVIYFHKEALASLRGRDLQVLGRNLNSWGAVDAFAYYLSGPAWRERQVSDKLIERWAHSHDRWWRRVALVSTVPLNSPARGGSGDTRRTLKICAMLIHDRDEMVVKALSWALRVLAKQHPKAVREFIRKHEAVLAARVRREVRNKLKTGFKNPRRRV